MRFTRFTCAVAGAAALAACATAPDRPTQKPSKAPETAQMRLCDGGGISNAPAADSDGRIVGFEPLTAVGGVTLARAPVRSCVSSGFGARRGGASNFHYGVDLYTREPKPVYAGGDGVVESVGTMRGYGQTVLIRHNGRVLTRYAHLSSYAEALRPGVRLRRGDLIGRTGRTGNATAVHLHYEIIVDGRRMDPLAVGAERFAARPGT